jgi:hypothetical protein
MSMMIKSARTLGLVAGASVIALSGAARAAEADDVVIETPGVDAGTPADVVVDEPKFVVDPVLIDDGGIMASEPKVDIVDEVPVEITRAGDDGIIDPTERTLPGGLDNPEIMYNMAGGGPVEMADVMAEQAADVAADRVVERVAATATAPTVADPE